VNLRSRPSTLHSPVRVLYSFPHKIGAGRICHTAWQQVSGLASAGASVQVHAASFQRAFSPEVEIKPTLARGRVRLPYKLVGSNRAFAMHDRIVARRLEKLAGQIDIVHTWPMGALETLKTANRLGIPTVLERPNAHTRFAYDVVNKECERLGVALPADHEHAYKEDVLMKEEAEYKLATRLLCPSDFVARTFADLGFPAEQLGRHQYGYDESVYTPGDGSRKGASGLTMLFVGVCAVRKGLHFALEAWLQSPASKSGTFSIAGAFLPDYKEKLAPMLAHPSVRVLGHRNDVPQLMRESDILVLPSIEEGSALVTSEARGSGCVLLVSDAAGAICRDRVNAFVHRVGDVEALSGQITKLHEDRGLLEQMRASSLRTISEITWDAAGKILLDVYRDTIEMKKDEVRHASV
jgi:glycosyltransferase involved in cell wall biosynthesis